ncbi:MAG TPA: TonB-dependent receptor, partial [Longimicrobiales bacterium]
AALVAQNNDSRGELPVVPDAGVSNAAISAVERLTTGPVEWIVGARVDHHSIDPTETKGLAVNAPTNRKNATSYNAGAVLHVTNLVSVRGNVGRAWRAPNLFELYADGPRIGEARYEVGDPSLLPERATEIDAGAEIASRMFRAQLSVFKNDVHDFIALQPTSEFRNQLRVYRHTQTRAELRGIEASAELRPLPHLSVVGEYDGVRGTDKNADEPLPWIPASRLQAHVEVAGTRGRFAHAYARTGVEHVSEKTRLATNEQPADSYTLVSFGAGGETMWNGHAVRIDMAVKNALNTKYKDFLNRYREFAFNPGRDISLRLSYDF